MTPLRNLVIAFALYGCAATGATVQLSQSGWTFGGPLTLTFTGQDANRDGRIDRSELSAFTAVYRLPQGGSTTWGIGDLRTAGFLFSDPGNYLFFATNPQYSLVDSASQGLVKASVIDQFLFPVDVTAAVPLVVPEPAGLAAIGVLALLLSGRKSGRRALNPPDIK